MYHAIHYFVNLLINKSFFVLIHMYHHYVQIVSLIACIIYIEYISNVDSCNQDKCFLEAFCFKVYLVLDEDK